MNTIIAENIEDLRLQAIMPTDFIFPRCKIIFGDHWLTYKAKVDTEIKSRNVNNEWKEFYVHVVIDDTCDYYDVNIILADDYSFCGLELLESSHTNDDKALGRAEYPAMQILGICNYIMSAKRNRKIIKGQGNNKNKIKKEIKTSIPQKVYLLDEIIEYVYENKLNRSNHNEIQCPCWSVRGHYRHYKSGKVVFVKNYLKGKKRDTEQPKPKEYFV